MSTELTAPPHCLDRISADLRNLSARFAECLETPGRYALRTDNGLPWAVARFDATPAEEGGTDRPWFSDYDEAE
jgi:hypothetical protein